MVAMKGTFDGKVIIPDEPGQLAPNQRVLVIPTDLVRDTSRDASTNFAKWLGAGNAKPLNPSPKFKSDDDLWAE